MGQTLTHGVYLPDEGERNCYNGLAANWSILDGAVGTIAEHTSALAGKAPLVHTHTKSDITDFPAYGTTAGTICEGNDSRLSDARTPVAHTHGKADVTDLLNSNFIPSANNSYDLGSSSNQWNNLYAKNYFYNGTAWGLDKENVWTGGNTFVSSFSKRNNAMTLGTTPAEVLYNSLFFKDKNNTLLASLDQQFNTDGSAHFVLRIAPNQSGATRVGAWEYIHDGTNRTMTFNATLCPVGGYHELGTSTYKWKTLNGVNPGALSLPDYSDTTYIDISGSIVPPSGQTTINYSGGENQYTPPVDGWLGIRCDGATFLQIYRNAYNCPGTTASRPDASGKLVVTLPVLKNTTYTIKINTSGTTNVFQLYPCLGNV